MEDVPTGAKKWGKSIINIPEYDSNLTRSRNHSAAYRRLLCKGGWKEWAKASFSDVPRFPSERPRAHKIVLKSITVSETMKRCHHVAEM